MTIANVPENYSECADCDTPQGDIICRACSDDEWLIKLRQWLVRATTVSPGLSNVEVAVVERLIEDLS